SGRNYAAGWRGPSRSTPAGERSSGGSTSPSSGISARRRARSVRARRDERSDGRGLRDRELDARCLVDLDVGGQDVGALVEAAVENRPGELTLERAADVAPQRTGAELGVEALGREPGDELRRDLERHSTLVQQPLGDRGDDQPADLLDLALGERLEDDELVDPVQELREERPLGGGEHALTGAVIGGRALAVLSDRGEPERTLDGLAGTEV